MREIQPTTLRAIAPDADRRAEPRFLAAGSIELLSEEAPEVVHGQLLDYSGSGFRALHACHALHAGQTVHFRHPLDHGRARVVWTRILNETVESGFVVLST